MTPEEIVQAAIDLLIERDIAQHMTYVADDVRLEMARRPFGPGGTAFYREMAMELLRHLLVESGHGVHFVGSEAADDGTTWVLYRGTLGPPSVSEGPSRDVRFGVRNGKIFVVDPYFVEE